MGLAGAGRGWNTPAALPTYQNSRQSLLNHVGPPLLSDGLAEYATLKIGNGTVLQWRGRLRTRIGESNDESFRANRHLAIGACALTIVLATWMGFAQQPRSRQTRQPDSNALKNAAQSKEWLTYGGNYAETRYSPAPRNRFHQRWALGTCMDIRCRIRRRQSGSHAAIFRRRFSTASPTTALPSPSTRKQARSFGDLTRWWIVRSRAVRQTVACAVAFSIAGSRSMKTRSSYLFWTAG